MSQGHKTSQKELKGNTLRVYVELLKSTDGRAGVRHIQRALRFSSPSLAQYHLERLTEMGLVKAEGGDYSIVREIRVDVLKEFMVIGTLIVPRLIVYAVMFTVLTAYFILQMSELNFFSVWALIFGLLGTGTYWYETIFAWKRTP